MLIVLRFKIRLFFGEFLVFEGMIPVVAIRSFPKFKIAFYCICKCIDIFEISETSELGSYLSINLRDFEQQKDVANFR
ncbi:MAG TPA: hypothetical protein DIT10_09485 [Chryseobacterium sp.]|nr:hypothetical protein [Chryseobacterium sp.]